MNEKKFDVYKQYCPSRTVLDLISNKWTILIIEKLSQKTYRFGQLKHEIEGLSQKVLTQTLRKLEGYRFIQRIEYEVLPLKVEYSLTESGKNLSSIFNLITNWAEKYAKELNL